MDDDVISGIDDTFHNVTTQLYVSQLNKATKEEVCG